MRVWILEVITVVVRGCITVCVTGLITVT